MEILIILQFFDIGIMDLSVDSFGNRKTDNNHLLWGLRKTLDDVHRILVLRHWSV